MRIYDFDVLILGGGPAGMSAAIYAARSNMSTAIIDVSMLGGQPSNYLELENYPGYPVVSGYELMEKFEEHVDRFNVQKFDMQIIKRVDLLSSPKVVETEDGIFYGKSIIIASGARPKRLGVEGEEDFIGRGVSYCAVCDGAFYKDKEVVVVGGGNSAVEEAIYLTRFARRVRVLHYRNELRADKIIQERAMGNPKLEFLMNTRVLAIRGDKNVDDVLVQDTVSGEVSHLTADGIFVYIGCSPNVDFVAGQLVQDERGFIVTDSVMQTSFEGVYAVGDVRNTPLRQVITATADGAVAAVYASKYVDAMMPNEHILTIT